jgi:cytochrome oxidase assembly protein ShyY1
MEGGGWLWLLVGLGTVVLGIAIALGTQLWRKRRKNRVTEAVREATTRENYRRGG